MVANPIHQGADLRALDAFEFTENTVNGWTEKQTYFHVQLINGFWNTSFKTNFLTANSTVTTVNCTVSKNELIETTSNFIYKSFYIWGEEKGEKLGG